MLHRYTSAHFHHVLPDFFFEDTATTELYTLSLHDALPISPILTIYFRPPEGDFVGQKKNSRTEREELLSVPAVPGSKDRKSTRLNSSHRCISYAVFCLKKKKKQKRQAIHPQLCIVPRPTIG